MPIWKGRRAPWLLWWVAIQLCRYLVNCSWQRKKILVIFEPGRHHYRLPLKCVSHVSPPFRKIPWAWTKGVFETPSRTSALKLLLFIWNDPFRYTIIDWNCKLGKKVTKLTDCIWRYEIYSAFNMPLFLEVIYPYAKLFIISVWPQVMAYHARSLYYQYSTNCPYGKKSWNQSTVCNNKSGKDNWFSLEYSLKHKILVRVRLRLREDV